MIYQLPVAREQDEGEFLMKSTSSPSPITIGPKMDFVGLAARLSSDSIPEVLSVSIDTCLPFTLISHGSALE